MSTVASPPAAGSGRGPAAFLGGALLALGAGVLGLWAVADKVPAVVAVRRYYLEDDLVVELIGMVAALVALAGVGLLARAWATSRRAVGAEAGLMSGLGWLISRAGLAVIAVQVVLLAQDVRLKKLSTKEMMDSARLIAVGVGAAAVVIGVALRYAVRRGAKVEPVPSGASGGRAAAALLGFVLVPAVAFGAYTWWDQTQRAALHATQQAVAAKDPAALDKAMERVPDLILAEVREALEVSRTSDDPATRRVAVQGLGRIGELGLVREEPKLQHQARLAGWTLMDMLADDPDPAVRQEAATALGKFGKPPRRVMGPGASGFSGNEVRLHGEDWGRRRDALKKASEGDSDEKVRAAAAKALALVEATKPDV